MNRFQNTKVPEKETPGACPTLCGALGPTVLRPEGLDDAGLLTCQPPVTIVPTQNQRAKEGEISLARRRWQEGTVYLRSSKKLPVAWWGRFVETVETASGAVRVQRNIRLGEAGSGDGKTHKADGKEGAAQARRCGKQLPAASREDPANGEGSNAVLHIRGRWQEEVLVHKKASTASSVRSQLNTLLLPTFGKLALGDVDSERVQTFLNRISQKMSPKSVKNVWATLRSMWNSAIAWKYITGELRVELPKARRLRMRCYSVEEVKRLLANSKGAEQIFFWLAVETGARVGELIALRASDVNLETMSLEINKAMWCGIEDAPKTEAGNRSICISSHLGAALKEHLAGRTDGYLFQTSEGSPWDASNIMVRRLNPLLCRLEIPKVDPKLLAKIVGGNRTIEQATRSEKRAASLGLHSFRHTNATAMDSLGIPQQIRKQRLGHSSNGVTEGYTHTFTQDERAVAEKLGELFGTGWPEKDKRRLISFPSLSQMQEWPAGANQQAIANQ